MLEILLERNGTGEVKREAIATEDGRYWHLATRHDGTWTRALMDIRDAESILGISRG